MEEEEKNLPIEIAICYIRENYRKLGSPDEMEYVTSADIVRDLAEMVTISITQITELMHSAGFGIKFIEGKPHWIVYPR